MGMVNTRARRKAAARKGTGKSGVCVVCKKHTSSAVTVKGKPYTDGDGIRHEGSEVLYDRECLKMQTKGLLNAGSDRKPKDSTGEICRGCNSIIAADEAHAHRQGKPFHRECLF